MQNLICRNSRSFVAKTILAQFRNFCVEKNLACGEKKYDVWLALWCFQKGQAFKKKWKKIRPEKGFTPGDGKVLSNLHLYYTHKGSIPQKKTEFYEKKIARGSTKFHISYSDNHIYSELR